jgi:molybdopterin-guanine dinucleotide biosynthesis protein A
MGMAKAWLQIEGKPILQWLLGRWQWPGPTMLVSAPSVVHPPGAELFDREVVDPIDGLGPLRGVLTALTHLSTPIMVLATVDMPGVNRSLLSWLAESLADRPQYSGVMCRVTTSDGQQIEPFPSASRSAAVAEITRRLDAGVRSVRGLCSDSAYCVLEAPPEFPAETWINLNTQADLAAFEAMNAVQKPEMNR